MKIAFINGSPRAERSTSAHMLSALEDRLKDSGGPVEIIHIPISLGKGTPVGRRLQAGGAVSDGSALFSCEAVVFAFPVYLDAIPAQLLRFLREAEVTRVEGQTPDGLSPGPAVYAIIGCGFIEGENTRVSMEMMKVWCRRTGCGYKRSIGYGGGGMGDKLVSGKWRGREIGRALKELAKNILSKDGGEDIITKATKSRASYNRSGNKAWKAAAKKRGLGKEDMLRFHGQNDAEDN